MRRQDVTVSSATASAPLPVDYRAQNFQIGIGCVLSAGASLTYKVQHTFDDVYAKDANGVATYNPATGNWFDHSTIVAQTANKDGNYAFPITAVRLVVTAYTSGNVTATFLQSSGQG